MGFNTLFSHGLKNECIRMWEWKSVKTLPKLRNMMTKVMVVRMVDGRSPSLWAHGLLGEEEEGVPCWNGADAWTWPRGIKSGDDEAGSSPEAKIHPALIRTPYDRISHHGDHMFNFLICSQCSSGIYSARDSWEEKHSRLCDSSMAKLRFTWFILLSVMTPQSDAIETGEFSINYFNYTCFHLLFG